MVDSLNLILTSVAFVLATGELPAQSCSMCSCSGCDPSAISFPAMPTWDVLVATATDCPSCQTQCNNWGNAASAAVNARYQANQDFASCTQTQQNATACSGVTACVANAIAADSTCPGCLAARDGLPSFGDKSAPVTIAVFSDFQCPYCARFAAMMKAVMSAEAGKVRLVFHTPPLPMHPWAHPAAEAALCAQRQGDAYFWALHDFIFEHQKEITPETLLPKLAAAAKQFTGFDQGRFATCLVERTTTGAVDADAALARHNGIHATPTIFINGQQTAAVAPE